MYRQQPDCRCSLQTDLSLTLAFYDCLQPRHYVLHVKGTLLEQLQHKGMNGIAVSSYSVTIDAQKHIHNCEGDTLVTIDEWMILDQALEKGGRLMND